MIKNIKAFVKIVVHEGPATILLFLGVLACVAMLVINLINPNFVKAVSTTDVTYIIFALLLADILYVLLKLKGPVNKSHETIDVYSDARISHIEPIFKNNKDIKILNAWVYNFSDVCHCIKETLSKSSSNVEITILDPDSEYVARRAAEIGFSKEELVEAIKHDITEMRIFNNTLSDSQQSRFKVYFADYDPKYSLYSSGEVALVGFTWPDTYAVHGPQILLDGRNGYLSNKIWSYYDQINKIEVNLDQVGEPANKAIQRTSR